MASPSAPSNKRSLGLWLATALVVGNMIGSGVFLLPSALAGYGSISIVGWLVTAAGAMLLALVFARLGRAFPKTGGPYAYTRRAFGDFIGFQTAWSYWINAWVGNAAIAVAFVGYFAFFWPALGDNNVLAAVVALAAIWLLTWVNAMGVRQGGIVQAVTTVIKVVPLIAIAILGLFFLETDNFATFNSSGQSNFGALGAVGALTLWAFIGVESATVPAENVENPRRNIPRATIYGTILVALVYILGTVAVMGVIAGPELAGSTSPFADAAEVMVGGWGGTVIAIAAMVSTFGALNGWILLQGQVPMAAARDRLFPKVFAKTSRNGTPVAGLVISSVLITLLMLTNYNASLVDLFTLVILLATLTALIPYAYSTAAQLMLFITDREKFELRSLVKDGLIASFAFLYSVWMIAGAGYQAVYQGFILLLAGVPVFLWMRWRAAREGERVIASGLAEDVAAHAEELDLPPNLEASLERLTQGQRSPAEDEITK